MAGQNRNLEILRHPNSITNEDTFGTSGHVRNLLSRVLTATELGVGVSAVGLTAKLATLGLIYPPAAIGGALVFTLPIAASAVQGLRHREFIRDIEGKTRGQKRALQAIRSAQSTLNFHTEDFRKDPLQDDNAIEDFKKDVFMPLMIKLLSDYEMYLRKRAARYAAKRKGTESQKREGVNNTDTSEIFMDEKEIGELNSLISNALLLAGFPNAVNNKKYEGTPPKFLLMIANLINDKSKTPQGGRVILDLFLREMNPQVNPSGNQGALVTASNSAPSPAATTVASAVPATPSESGSRAGVNQEQRTEPSQTNHRANTGTGTSSTQPALSAGGSPHHEIEAVGEEEGDENFAQEEGLSDQTGEVGSQAANNSTKRGRGLAEPQPGSTPQGGDLDLFAFKHPRLARISKRLESGNKQFANIRHIFDGNPFSTELAMLVTSLSSSNDRYSVASSLFGDMQNNIEMPNYDQRQYSMNFGIRMSELLKNKFVKLGIKSFIQDHVSRSFPADKDTMLWNRSSKSDYKQIIGVRNGNFQVNDEMVSAFFGLMGVLIDPTNYENGKMTEAGKDELNQLIKKMLDRSTQYTTSFLSRRVTGIYRGISKPITDALIKTALNFAGVTAQENDGSSSAETTNIKQLVLSSGQINAPKLSEAIKKLREKGEEKDRAEKTQSRAGDQVSTPGRRDGRGLLSRIKEGLNRRSAENQSSELIDVEDNLVEQKIINILEEKFGANDGKISLPAANSTEIDSFIKFRFNHTIERLGLKNNVTTTSEGNVEVSYRLFIDLCKYLLDNSYVVLNEEFIRSVLQNLANVLANSDSEDTKVLPTTTGNLKDGSNKDDDKEIIRILEEEFETDNGFIKLPDPIKGSELNRKILEILRGIEDVVRVLGTEVTYQNKQVHISNKLFTFIYKSLFADADPFKGEDEINDDINFILQELANILAERDTTETAQLPITADSSVYPNTGEHEGSKNDEKKAQDPAESEPDDDYEVLFGRILAQTRRLKLDASRAQVKQDPENTQLKPVTIQEIIDQVQKEGVVASGFEQDQPILLNPDQSEVSKNDWNLIDEIMAKSGFYKNFSQAQSNTITWKDVLNIRDKLNESVLSKELSNDVPIPNNIEAILNTVSWIVRIKRIKSELPSLLSNVTTNIDKIARYISDSSPEIRCLVPRSIVNVKQAQELMVELGTLSEDPNEYVRASTAFAMGFDRGLFAQELEKLKNDPYQNVRNAAEDWD